MASDTPPYEFLWLVKESAYGTQMSVPTAGVDSIYIRLAGANRFTVRPKKVSRVINFGGGYDIPGYRKSDQNTVEGNLQVELCYSQAQFLLDWALTKVNSGGTTPWTTTEPPGDLASVVAYHGIMRSDGTVKRRRYKGGKVRNGKLGSSADSGVAMLNLGLGFQKWDGNSIDSTSDPDATAFPAPADTAFPTDPVLHVDMGTTGLSLNSSGVASVSAVELSWTNKTDPLFFANPFLAFERLRGRNAQLDATVLFTASPDWRALYEAYAAFGASVTWTGAAHTILVDYKGNNIIDPGPDDDLTPGKVYMQKLTLGNQWDTSASADVAFTFT